ncbi:MAG: ech hydrogenase subunit [Deltaproteobacteria bacterium]|jgi:formate hydrogenlyase subunit 6/NADH:ubiquinone oxidoreductase subunit I|nr:ech hydrogenase subunit [Deltaproteobacteria bacterium]
MKSFTMAKTVIENLLKGPATLMYPQRKRTFTAITRGKIENEYPKCIFCGLCSKRCPNYAIAVSKEKKEWEIDRLKCCMCNLCVDVCPVKCLSTDNQYSPPVTEKKMGIQKLGPGGS